MTIVIPGAVRTTGDVPCPRGEAEVARKIEESIPAILCIFSMIFPVSIKRYDPHYNISLIYFLIKL
jgi:hypothetical protein